MNPPNASCAECEQPIEDKHFLVALNRSWHEECLRCACCKCRLFELSDRFYTRAGLILCARDYVRLFGLSGRCELCSGQIAPADWVMAIGTAAGHRGHKVFAHLECFACSVCKGRFCVGEPFYFRNGLIFCQKDFIGVDEGKDKKIG